MNKYTNYWDKELFIVRVVPGGALGKKSDYIKRIVFALLLSHVDSFNQEVINARNILCINKTIQISEKPKIEEILSLERKYFSPTRLFVLEELASKIIFKYHLPEIWLIPIKVLIITNILYVIPNSSISFHYPVIENNPVLSRSILLNMTPPFNGLADAISAYRLSRKPAIIINENISPSKLIELIKKNSKSIQKLIATAGRSTISQTQEKTWFWGVVAAVFINDGISKWSDMDKIINTPSPGNPFQTDTDDPILCNPPEKTDLQTYHKNFIASLKNIAS